MRSVQTTLVLGMAALAACSPKTDTAARDSAAPNATSSASGATNAGATNPGAGATSCAGDAGGITLPAGFCATVFADSLGRARHLAVAPNGDVYVNTWVPGGKGKAPAGGLLIALRDANHDGRADSVVRFGPSIAAGGTGGTGIAVHGGALYAEAGPAIVRYALPSGGMAPTAARATVVTGLPVTKGHTMHPFAIDSSNTLYVDIGSATNSCQTADRTLESPGHKPCTELVTRAGIWAFDATKTGQRVTPAARYATGIRNAVGIAIGPDGQLWNTQHGRDQLAENWPKLYDAAQGQEQPAEELMKTVKGGDYGWPECYYDPAQKKLVLAPEYGGDGGKATGDCGTKLAPVAAFPAHWAPDDLVFYTGSQFPEKYRGGAFIAFHGSWNRAPGPQGGYKVSFVPMSGGQAGTMETFADGFAGANVQPDAAAHRPTGLAVGPDGALYIADDKGGRVWRVTYGR